MWVLHETLWRLSINPSEKIVQATIKLRWYASVRLPWTLSANAYKIKYVNQTRNYIKIYIENIRDHYNDQFFITFNWKMIELNVHIFSYRIDETETNACSLQYVISNTKSCQFFFKKSVFSLVCYLNITKMLISKLSVGLETYAISLKCC